MTGERQESRNFEYFGRAKETATQMPPF